MIAPALLLLLAQSAQSAADRVISNDYDLIIEGESYRPRLKPRLAPERKGRAR